jgi:hypothetical protein
MGFLSQVFLFVLVNNIGTYSSRPSVAEVEAGLQALADHVTLALNCLTYLVMWSIHVQ